MCFCICDWQLRCPEGHGSPRTISTPEKIRLRDHGHGRGSGRGRGRGGGRGGGRGAAAARLRLRRGCAAHPPQNWRRVVPRLKISDVFGRFGRFERFRRFGTFSGVFSMSRGTPERRGTSFCRWQFSLSTSVYLRRTVVVGERSSSAKFCLSTDLILLSLSLGHHPSSFLSHPTFSGISKIQTCSNYTNRYRPYEFHLVPYKSRNL